jgi:signal transduction histidine kinase
MKTLGAQASRLPGRTGHPRSHFQGRDLVQKNQFPVPKISLNLQAVLEQIAADVVDLIGCVATLVTTLENGQLVVRANALAIDSTELATAVPEADLSLLQPGAIIPLQDAVFSDNAAGQALFVENGRAFPLLTSTRLSDFLKPLISPQAADRLQQAADIQQVAVLPFLLQSEVIGGLFVALREPLTGRTLDFLHAFGRQAAIAIQNQRHLEAMQALERTVLRLQARMTDENEVLQHIADAVVTEMGYAAALVATLENGNALPVRAYAMAVDRAEIQAIEQSVGIQLRSKEAVVYLDDARYEDNLSVRAVKGLNGRPENYLIADKLYDLLRPLVSTAVAEYAQALMGIKQVIAVPFFQADQVVGNLFVASRQAQFSPWEISLLTALGQQAAVGLHNARLYQQMARQRQIAQTFSRMAFSTIASAHALRNYIGNVNSYLQLQQLFPQLSPERRDALMQELPAVLNEIGKAIDVLDTLNSPWQQGRTEQTDVRDALRRALQETFPRTPLFSQQTVLKTESNITVRLDLTAEPAPVCTAKDMLAEAFRIILKNAVEALMSVEWAARSTEGGQRAQAQLLLQSRRTPETVEVTIQDNGPGILPHHLPLIFELGWSTKNGSGMGFGLFWTRDFIEGLGGTITVHSQPGAGATFVVVLPIDASEAIAEN